MWPSLDSSPGVPLSKAHILSSTRRCIQSWGSNKGSWILLRTQHASKIDPVSAINHLLTLFAAPERLPLKSVYSVLFYSVKPRIGLSLSGFPRSNPPKTKIWMYAVYLRSEGTWSIFKKVTTEGNWDFIPWGPLATWWVRPVRYLLTSFHQPRLWGAPQGANSSALQACLPIRKQRGPGTRDPKQGNPGVGSWKEDCGALEREGREHGRGAGNICSKEQLSTLSLFF